MSFKTKNDEPKQELMNIFESLSKDQLRVLASEFRQSNYGGLKVAVDTALSKTINRNNEHNITEFTIK